MSIASDILQAIAFPLLLLSINVNSLPCEDSRCKTGSCNSTGSCICSLPDPSTILDGDRPFLGGRFCDEEQVLCDGTNSFWCEHGGRCEEIVQGENYSCSCPPGYAGSHCEHLGAPCGRIFCFHEAECLVEDRICQCPPHWRGSADCSLPTLTPTDSSRNSTATRLPQDRSSGNTNWAAVVLGISLSGGAVGAIVYANKFFTQKKKTAIAKFQQLSQSQNHDFLEEDEDDSHVHGAVLNDSSHL
ncbi:uncharacterized protein LOC131166348 [Malania oleifera]|uniref:uncharacterized protein LOC131166348 n=1 Tax=Malania oleifera TaxID=397392 RepID=UPI0025AEA963|nr:uncharacterized protein LOC131166348 [Malania oleifera]